MSSSLCVVWAVIRTFFFFHSLTLSHNSCCTLNLNALQQAYKTPNAETILRVSGWRSYPIIWWDIVNSDAKPEWTVLVPGLKLLSLSIYFPDPLFQINHNFRAHWALSELPSPSVEILFSPGFRRSTYLWWAPPTL